MWPSVAREVRIWDGIAPLLWRGLRAKWSGDVVCVDASPYGLGACLTRVEPSEATAVGQHYERRTFCRRERIGPRQRAAAFAAEAVGDCECAGALGLSGPVRDNSILGTGPERDAAHKRFPEVPISIFREKWMTIGRHR